MKNLNNAIKNISAEDADNVVELINELDTDNYYGHSDLLESLARQAAQKYLGYSHGSDKYDNMTDFEIKMEMGLYADSSEDSDSSYDMDFEGYEYMSDIKDNFGSELRTAIKEESLKDLEAFTQIHELLISSGKYTGTLEDLEIALKKSTHFKEIAFGAVTRYDG